MPYTHQQKRDALEQVIMSGGDLDAVSAKMKINKETLRRWLKDAPPVLDQLQTHIEGHALKLAKDLLSEEETLPLNQRASALGMLIDRLLKLEALKVPADSTADEAHNTIEIVYRRANGSHTAQPDWRREGSDHAHND